MIEVSGEFCFLYSTFPDADSALKVARVLIDGNLAACVNVYPPMTSVYVWEG
jgi:periplasmic divalent cation tolerance protein